MTDTVTLSVDEYLALKAQIHEAERLYEQKATALRVANKVLFDLGINTWDTSLKYSTVPTEETKESIIELIAYGKSVLELEKQIAENATALHYWTRMLTFLKLGDDNGTFSGIKGTRSNDDEQ